MKTIAIANQKGGTGKTTTAYNLGIALTQQGYRVLMVDFDPQGNLSCYCGIPPEQDLEQTITELLMKVAYEKPLSHRECVYQSKRTDDSAPQVDFIPSNLRLASFELAMGTMMCREVLLKTCLEQYSSQYDYCIIDCSPSVGLLLTNALSAANEVIIPMQAQPFSVVGMSQLTNSISSVQRKINPGLHIRGVLLTMTQHTKVSEHYAHDVRAKYGRTLRVFTTEMSMIYINTSDDERLFKQLNYFSPPLLLLFFVRSGLNFDLGAIFSSSDHIGSASLLAVGVVYFVTRILGKYIGAFLGCLLAGKNKKVRNNLGLALIPQAGVAIGLAAMGARTLGGAMGDALETIILASSVLYELIGPACAKLSLYLSGSYSNRLDDIVTETVKCDGHEPENEVERLIRQIQAIQKELPAHNDPFLEDEQAYDEAAYEHYALTGYPQVSYQNTRRKADIWTL